LVSRLPSARLDIDSESKDEREMKGQSYEDLPVEKLESHLTDDGWVAEQKLDGTRVMIHITEDDITFSGVNGDPVKFAAAAQHFDNLKADLFGLLPMVIDGELIIETGVFWAFDLPYCRGFISPEHALKLRREALGVVVGKLDSGLVKIVPQAAGYIQKRRLWDNVANGGGEGIVLKKLDAPYHVGRRTRDVLKVKHLKTVDAVIVERDRDGAKNMVLALYQGTKLVEIGACSAIGKGEPPVGSVVEVCFLYWTGERVYQPRMMRVREDKHPMDCEWRQLDGALVNRIVVGF
jgi:ATP-dependent DNA ligase